MSNKRILYLSYNGLLEPILHSQGLPYMRGLLRQRSGRFILLTFEKKKDLKNYGLQYVYDLKKQLEKEGIEWHLLRYHKSPSLLATLFDVINGLVHSIFLVVFKQVNLVHARGIVSASIALGLNLIFRIQFIFDMRNFLAEAYVSAGRWRNNSPNFKLVKFMEKLVLRTASATIVESYYHRQLIAENSGINAEVIPCCVDMEKFQFKTDKDSSLLNDFGLDDSFRLIYIGSLGTWYMMNEMLDFFKTMSECGDYPSLNLVFVTSYNYSLILKTVKDRKIDIKKIKILSLPHNRMPNVLSLSNVGIAFIKPYERMDSFPTKIGEYLASGLPIILNAGMGDAEKIVRENNVGVVIDEFSEQGYKKGLCNLRELLKEGKSLNIRCRKIAEENLSLEKGIKKYYKIYSKVIA